MSFSTRFDRLEAPRARLLVLNGRVDSIAAAVLDESLREGLGSHGEPLLVDFAGIDYICSMGLRSVLMAAKRARQHSQRLVLAGLQPNVRDVFEISGFLEILDVAPTVGEAQARLTG